MLSKLLNELQDMYSNIKEDLLDKLIVLLLAIVVIMVAYWWIILLVLCCGVIL